MDMYSHKYIFDCVLKYAGNGTVLLCSLHKPCKGNYCSLPQNTQVIDFDSVKEKWDKAHKNSSHSSVDALAYNKKLCFVEIKGWIKFLENQKILKKDSLTEKDTDTLKKKIDKQSASYDYQKKLLDSIILCENISGQNNIGKDVPIQFILVTDINPATSPIESFAEQLFMLANTSTSWEKICSETMYNHLKDQLGTNNTFFIQCKDFDDFIKNHG
jgi:hypothetical protein